MRADLVTSPPTPPSSPPASCATCPAGHLARRNPHLLTNPADPGYHPVLGANPRVPAHRPAPERLEHGALGTGSIVFFVVAAAAPLTVMAGIAPLAIMIGGTAPRSAT